MEWGSFSASPTELIDFRHDVSVSHFTPRHFFLFGENVTGFHTLSQVGGTIHC